MATKANIIIDQGTTFSTSVFLTDEAGNPYDLDGFTAEAQMRRWDTSSNAISFAVSINTGSLILSMNAETTSSLDQSRYVYDIVLTDAENNITRVVEGIVTVNPSVTRE